MDFVLRYRGELPAHKQCIEQKNAIRCRLHSQLVNLCQAQPLLGGVLAPQVETARLNGRSLDVEHLRVVREGFNTATLGHNLFFRVEVGPYRFIPIVTRPHELVCELDIRWLRRERAGSLVLDGGDLDNRLKNLFDSLRIPHNADEVRGIPDGFQGRDLLCLLEDDSLITKLSIETYRIWEPMGLGDIAAGTKETDVELDIRVTIKSTHPMWGNIGFPASSS